MTLYAPTAERKASHAKVFHPTVRAADQAAALGRFDHSWHIDNRVFTRDLFETLKGDLDRQLIPTREEIGGRLHLRRP